MAQELIQVDGNFSTTIEDLVDKSFYGLRQNKETGQAFIDVIKGDEPIRLPNEFESRSDDYLNWMWSYNTFRYSYNQNTGRLQLEVL